MSSQKSLDDLVQTLNLEKLEENLYRGECEKTAWGRVFGGQVLGQALSSAYNTIEEERYAHSFHAYFLRPGRIDMPIVYQVVRIRDGGSFTTRTVDAIQNGEVIFNMSVSFQKDEGGFEHQFDMPDVPGPEELKSERELRESMMDQIPEEYRDGFLREKAIELRTVEQFNPLNDEKKPPYKHTWMKANGNLPEDILVHQNILAYASDFGLLSTAQLPHGIGWGGMNRKVMAASIDHAMWFHRPFRADEWLLYVTDSPSASNAKGFNRGSVYTREGILVASAIQEGLMRKIKPSKDR